MILESSTASLKLSRSCDGGWNNDAQQDAAGITHILDRLVLRPLLGFYCEASPMTLYLRAILSKRGISTTSSAKSAREQFNAELALSLRLSRGTNSSASSLRPSPAWPSLTASRVTAANLAHVAERLRAWPRYDDDGRAAARRARFSAVEGRALQKWGMGYLSHSHRWSSL